MVATSGDRLISEDALETLKERLLPLATVLTPNIPEAEILSGVSIADTAGMEAAARAISERYGCAVLCKGGHQVSDADDLLWRNGAGKWFHGRRISNPNTHGTGCTLSSAIASNLAKGRDLDTAVRKFVMRHYCELFCMHLYSYQVQYCFLSPLHMNAHHHLQTKCPWKWVSQLSPRCTGR